MLRLDKTIRGVGWEMNKSALIGISALIGGLAIYNKTFKAEYEAEVFMADRIVAIRANKITPFNPKYTNLQQESYKKIQKRIRNSPLRNLYGSDWQKLVGSEGQAILFNSNNRYTSSYIDFDNSFRQKTDSIIRGRDEKILTPYNTKLRLIVLSLSKKMQELYKDYSGQGILNNNQIRDNIKLDSSVERGVKNYFNLISEVLEKMPNVRVRTLGGYSYGKDLNNNFITTHQNNYEYNAVFHAMIGSYNYGNYNDINEKAKERLDERRNYNHILFIATPKLVAEYTEADIKDIEKDFKDKLNVGMYASVLDWMDFLKANPSVKTIGRTSRATKYYDKVFDRYNAPKQLKARYGSFAQVLDVALFEKAFIPAHLEEMIPKLTKEQRTILTKAIQKNKRQGNRQEVLEQQIIEPNKKIVTSALNTWFSQYDTISETTDPRGKQKMLDIYLYFLSPRYEPSYSIKSQSLSNVFRIGGKNWIQDVKIKTVTKDNKGIYKKTDMPLQNKRNIQALKDLVNVDDIKVPSTLKTNAKPRYEEEMQRKINSMERKLQDERNRLKQSEIKLNNAKREKARIEKIL